MCMVLLISLCVPRLQVAHLYAALRGDLADLVDLLPCGGQQRLDLVYARTVDDEDHADAVVERAGHLERLDAAVAHEEAEDGREVPRGRVDGAAGALGQHARDVLREAAASDVRHALDEPRLDERQQRLDVDFCGAQELLAERVRGVPGARARVRQA